MSKRTATLLASSTSRAAPPPPPPPETYNEVVDALGSMVKSHWRCDPASGSNVTDRKGVQNGTLSGTRQYFQVAVPIAQQDASGRCLAVDGTGKLTIPNNAAYNATSGAICLLVQSDQIGAQQILISRPGTSSGDMSLEIRPDGRARLFRYDVSGGAPKEVISANPLVPGDAYAIAGTWGAAGLVLLVNGVVVGSDGTAVWPTTTTSDWSVARWATDIAGLDGCFGHIVFIAGTQPTTAQIGSLALPKNVAWAEDIDAGSVETGTSITIDPKLNTAHYKSPIFVEIVLDATIGDADGSGENLNYDADAGILSNTPDTFTYRFTSANGAVSNTATINVTVTPAVVGSGITMLGSWPLSQTSGNFADATGTNTATLTVPSWTIATHEYNRPGIVVGSDHALEISNGGPAITLITSPVNYRQAAMSLVVYIEPQGELRGVQYYNNSHEAFGREVIACCDSNIDATTNTAGGFCIYRRRTAWNENTWRLGGWVRGANGAKNYFSAMTGVSGANLLIDVPHRVVLTMGPAGAKLWLDGSNVATIAGVTLGWAGLNQPIRIGNGPDTGHADRRSPFLGRVDQIEVWQGQIDPTSGAGSRPAATAPNCPYRVPSGTKINLSDYAARANPLQDAINDAHAANGAWVFQPWDDTTYYLKPLGNTEDGTCVGMRRNCRGLIGVRYRRRSNENQNHGRMINVGDFSASGGQLGSSPGDIYGAEGGYRFIGCHIDGNARGQDQALVIDGQNYQHAACLWFDTRSSGHRTSVTLDQCRFYDNPTDATCSQSQTKLTAKSCRIYGCRRGWLTTTGFGMINVTYRNEVFESSARVGGRTDIGTGLCDNEPFSVGSPVENKLHIYDTWAEGDWDDRDFETTTTNSESWYTCVHLTKSALALHPVFNSNPDRRSVGSVKILASTVSFYRRGFLSSPSGGGSWPLERFNGFRAGVSGEGAVFDDVTFLANGRPFCMHQFLMQDPANDGGPLTKIDYLTGGMAPSRFMTIRNSRLRATRLPSSISKANTRFLVCSGLSTSWHLWIDGLDIGPEFANQPIVLGGATLHHANITHQNGSGNPWTDAGAVVPI